jgi:hypothetical protein
MNHFASITIALALASTPAFATTRTDPVDDFLAGFTGPQNPNLDVIETGAITNGVFVELTSLQNGPVAETPALYIWGVNRGAGTNPFAVAPGVFFDAVLVVNGDGTGTLFGNPLPAGAISVDGNRLTVRVPLALLPSTGFAPVDYSYNLWPRAPGISGVPGISDFAPDNSSFTATFVPEASTWALLITGFGLVGAVARRRRSAHA